MFPRGAEQNNGLTAVIADVAYFGISSFGTRSERDAPTKTSEARGPCRICLRDSCPFPAQVSCDKFFLYQMPPFLSAPAAAGGRVRPRDAEAPLEEDHAYKRSAEHRGAFPHQKRIDQTESA